MLNKYTNLNKTIALLFNENLIISCYHYEAYINRYLKIIFFSMTYIFTVHYKVTHYITSTKYIERCSTIINQIHICLIYQRTNV